MKLLQPSVARTIIVLGAILCTAFECTQSTTPLSSRTDGFVDEALIGNWYGAEVTQDGLIDTYDHVVTVDAAGNMRIDLIPGTIEPGFGISVGATFEGFSTHFNGQTYLNLRLVDVTCENTDDDNELCEEDGQSKIEDNDCPYIIARYSHAWSIPDAYEDYWTDMRRWRLGKEVERLGSDLVELSFLDDELVSRAIENGGLGGQSRCPECVVGDDGSSCISASFTSLQKFVSENGESLFNEHMHFVRYSSEPELSHGFALGASRDAILQQLNDYEWVTVVRYSTQEIVALGSQDGEGPEIRRVFRLDNARLFEIVDQPLENATLSEIAAHSIRRPIYLGKNQYKSSQYITTSWKSVTYSADFRVPLANCVENTDRKLKSQEQRLGNLVAAALIAQCMSDYRLFLSIERTSTSGSGWQREF